MKAVLKLVLTHFTGTPLLAITTAAGALALLGGSAMLLFLPPLFGSEAGTSRVSDGVQTLIFLSPVAGVIAVAFGASLLPTLFARLAASHYLYVLPHGRIKILASVFVTLTIVALVVAGTTTVYYMRTPLQLDVVFKRAFVVALLTTNLLYVVLWLTGKSSSAIGLLVGSIVMIATILVPLPFIAMPSRSLGAPWAASLLIWALFGAAFLLAPRWKGAAGRVRQSIAGRLAGASYEGGGEVAFLLGTARPWTLALAQIVPILMASYFLAGFEVVSASPSMSNPWLLFMTILSVLAGAIASMAATRSRRLWLRAPWTRAQLFRRVEDALWRHNSFALGVLLVLLVVLGSQPYVPTKVLVFGMGLAILGVAFSTYLGMLITAPINWLDTALAVAAMVLLMIAAVYASRPVTPFSVVIGFEAALAALALVFRAIAQRRWAHLDWMRCRADATVRAAA
jgi:hypothetical protein